jgi:hypothetical protein
VCDVGVEENIAEEILLESARERLEEVFRVGGREECLHNHQILCCRYMSIWCWGIRTDPEYPRSPTATKSVRLPADGERNDSVYSSSSIPHISFLSFLKTFPRYRVSANEKKEKKARMRAMRPGGLPASGLTLKIARRIEVLTRRWRRPILREV